MLSRCGALLSRNLYKQAPLTRSSTTTSSHTASESASSWSKMLIGAVGAASFATYALAQPTTEAATNTPPELTEAPVYRIAITGGPCAGKSSGMEAIKDRFDSLGYNVYVVPEMATIMLTNGVSYTPNMTSAQIFAFQTGLMKGMFALEDAIVGIARASGQKSIVLMDRGSMDPAAYMSPTLWQAILDEHNWNVASLRDKRYDAVLHLVSAADGAEKFYTTQNNTARRETPEEARQIDEKLKQVWVGHPNLFVIDNSSDFKTKIRRTTEVICRITGEPLPGKVDRVFKVKSFELPKDLNYSTFEISDVYLSEGRARRRSSPDGNSFSFSTLRSKENNEAVTERATSGRTYNKFVDEAVHTVEKTRHVFLHENTYFHIDEYKSIDGEAADMCVLIAETSDSTQAITLPPFVQVDREMQGQERFTVFENAMGVKGKVKSFFDKLKH